jgi:outer membrane protein assembly factor BamB
VILSSPVVDRIDTTGPVVFFGDSGKFDGDVGHEWAMNGVGNSRGACTKRWVFTGWKNPGPDGNKTSSWSPPALITKSVARPLLVFGSSNPDDSVYVLDARNGKLLWSFQTKIKSPDDDVGAAPTISPPGVNGFPHGVVYVAAKDKIEYALDLARGTKIWEYDLRAGAGGRDANSQSGTALVGKRVVVPYSHFVFSLDAVTGKKIWRSPQAGNNYFASAVVSGASGDQVVFIGDSGGVVHAYRVSDGSEAFRLHTGGNMYSSAAVAYGGVFFTSDTGHLYALG